MSRDGTPPSATSRPRTVLYVADTERAASDGAAALEAVESGPTRSVHAVTTVERVRNWAAEADCVVFAETPTTAAGATLLEVVDACGETPLVLFTESSYAPTAARSTDGIDGYVRRDTDDAVSHLADEIEWVCAGAGTVADGPERESESEPAAIALAGDRAPSTDRAAERLLEAVPELAACRDRDRLFELVVETVADALERDRCWLSTVNFGTFEPRVTTSAIGTDELSPLPREGPLEGILQSGEALRIDDLAADDRLAAPLADAASLCCVPVGDVGLLCVAAAEPDAFDEADCEVLSAWCQAAGAVRERIDDETGRRRERDRLENQRDRFRSERDRLAEERDRLEDERDRFRALFANVPEPTIRYETEDGRPVVRDVNDAFREVFDVDPESITGTPVGEDAVPPGLEHRQTALADALRSGERRQLVSRRESVEGVREFLLTLVPVEPDPERDDHNPEGLIVYSDVTAANRTERELAAARARLETITDLVDDGVRTPLNVARGYLELAAETGDPDHFAEVDEAQELLRERIDELAAIAREDDVLVETEPVAVHDVARRAWVAVDTGDARLVTQAPNDRVLEADKARLRELFEHVLAAVIDETAESEGGTDGGGGRDDGTSETPPVVTVGATDDGFYVARRASEDADEGSPATEPVPGQLAAADGTGYGLGTVERIADAHGWDVGVAEDGDRIAFAFRGVDSADDGPA
ncbi:GAF domain-containing protein [Natrinema thermotolerans]|uniref:GAF domain-containing protein n=1 Tax=Natrinema thermotolerans TaxID=121872 RepID=A0AAF0PF53_9EURY|nr:GAF domain-containing protein [Natrinema thermotolerans]WMT10011.1 GAF domain-containing protein [Natrinema thermotolerans]